jgi:hypothetical protein
LPSFPGAAVGIPMMLGMVISAMAMPEDDMGGMGGMM